MAARRSTSKPPWQRPRPKGGRKTALTNASKKKAASRARRAGRGYPNLVDNLRAAVEQRASTTRKKAKKTTKTGKRGKKTAKQRKR